MALPLEDRTGDFEQPPQDPLALDADSDIDVGLEALKVWIAYWEGIFGALPGYCAIVFDRSLVYRYAVGPPGRWLQDPRELIGRTPREVFGESVHQRLKPFYRAALRGETVSWVDPVGGRSWACRVAPVSLKGRIIGGAVVFREVE